MLLLIYALGFLFSVFIHVFLKINSIICMIKIDPNHYSGTVWIKSVLRKILNKLTYLAACQFIERLIELQLCSEACFQEFIRDTFKEKWWGTARPFSDSRWRAEWNVQRVAAPPRELENTHIHELQFMVRLAVPFALTSLFLSVLIEVNIAFCGHLSKLELEPPVSASVYSWFQVCLNCFSLLWFCAITSHEALRCMKTASIEKRVLLKIWTLLLKISNTRIIKF